MKSNALASARRTVEYVRLLEKQVRELKKENARLRAEQSDPAEPTPERTTR